MLTLEYTLGGVGPLLAVRKNRSYVRSSSQESPGFIRGSVKLVIPKCAREHPLLTTEMHGLRCRMDRGHLNCHHSGG